MIDTKQLKTTGEFATEPLAWAWFDEMVERSKAFKIYREVEGQYLQPRLDTDEKGARIDRIIWPLERAVSAGWGDGPIGIEGKSSGSNAGHLIVQAQDYSRCVFEIPRVGYRIVLKWIFIFPIEAPVSAVASIMAQNRIGWASASNGDSKQRLVFGCGGIHGIEIDEEGNLKAKRLPMGGKRGSR